MARETLFAILLRQPWWVTLVVALLVFALARSIYPPVAPFMALPFGAMAIYIAVRQWRSGGSIDAPSRLAQLRAMPWEEFSALITDTYRRQGYTVAESDSQGYDFKLTRDGRITLLQCRRWKVNQVGVGPVRDLVRAVEREGASRGICIAAGDFSEPARKLIATEPVALLSGAELANLARAPKKTSKASGYLSPHTRGCRSRTTVKKR